MTFFVAPERVPYEEWTGASEAAFEPRFPEAEGPDPAVARALGRAAAALGLPRSRLFVASGGLCRLAQQWDGFGFDGVAALAVAAGARLASPGLLAVAAEDRLDASALSSLALRDPDVACLVYHRPGDPDPAPAAFGAGARFVARASVGDAGHLGAVLLEALRHKGLSVVACLPASTPVRRVDLGRHDPEDRAAAAALLAAADGEAIPVGVLYRQARPWPEESEPLKAAPRRAGPF